MIDPLSGDNLSPGPLQLLYSAIAIMALFLCIFVIAAVVVRLFV